MVAGMGLTGLFLWWFTPAQALVFGLARHVAVAALVVLAAIGAGWAARERDWATALLVGFPLFGTAAAILSWISVVAVAPLVFLCAAAGLLLLIRHPPVLRAPHFLLLLPALYALGAALIPVSSPDELIYKLAVPHAYEMYGRMVELPLNSHSYLTLAPHFTDLAALILGGGIPAKLARFALYLAALATLWRLAERYTPRPHWIVAIVAWTPALAVTAGWCWDEWGLIGLFALTLDRNEDRQGLAVALGAALATKYTAIPWVMAFVIVQLFRRRLVFSSVALVALLGGFFYVRNVFWTGSPVAPMLTSGAPPVLDYRHGWGNLLFDPGMVDESLGILLPLAALAAVFAIPRRELRDLLVLGGLQLPLLLALSPIAHNVAPSLLPLAIAGGVVLIESGMAWRIVAAIALVVQWSLITFVLAPYGIGTYLAGQTEAQYIRTRYEFAVAYEWIGKSTPGSARVLLLGETRTFYLQREFVAGGNLDGPRIAAWLGSFRTADALHRELRARGITHVLMSKAGYRIAGTGRPLTLVEKEQFLEVTPQAHAVVAKTLETHSRMRFRDDNYYVFELR